MAKSFSITSQPWTLSVFALVILSIAFILMSHTFYLSNPITIVVEQQNVNVAIDRLDELEFDDMSWLVQEMFNSVTRKRIICDPNKYKYTKLLLKDIIDSNLDEYKIKTTSNEIESDYLKWKNECWNDRKCWFWNKKMRIQIIDHQMFVSGTKYEMEKHIYDKEGYRTGLLFYLCELQRKYAKYLENTDFIWYYHDYKKKTLHKYNWKINGNIPYFFTDYNLAHVASPESKSNLLLFTVSRAYLKYRYFAAKIKANRKETKQDKEMQRLVNAENYRRIADYFEWLDLLQNLTVNNKLHLLTWNGKYVNKALFRGAANSKYRDELYSMLINNTYIYDRVTWKYFDICFTNAYALAARDGPHSKRNLTLSLMQQLKYRYIIVCDGISVRDSLMYQMKMGSVILKQLTTNYEWWYFDVIDGYHWVIFENVQHLISIVMNMARQVDGYYDYKTSSSPRDYSYLLNHSMTSFTYQSLQQITQNSRKFIDEYLNENDVDCFMVHMIQIYNKYLFDASSVNKSRDEYMRQLPPDLY